LVSEGGALAPVLEIKNLTKAFPDGHKRDLLPAVENLNLTIDNKDEGEFVALLGPSGCGKSTILSMVSGLAEPTSGEVHTFGKLVCGPNPDAVTVQQAYTCFPWLTALGNVEFGLRVVGKGGSEARDIATDYLNRVGLGDRLNARPKEMSGGMQQRIAIARALAVKTRMLLMDEPFGALDAQTRSDMQQMLMRLWSEEKQSILFVTHDITEAVLLADRVLVFSPRPARIVEDVAIPFSRPRVPDITSTPEFLHVSHLLLEILKKTPASGQIRVSV